MAHWPRPKPDFMRHLQQQANTFYKLIINFGLEGFFAEGWESERNVQINVSVAKLIFESK